MHTRKTRTRRRATQEQKSRANAPEKMTPQRTGINQKEEQQKPPTRNMPKYKNRTKIEIE